MELKIRGDLSPRSDVVATLKHGEKIDIVQMRRRFVKLRAKNGVEGWTDTRQLMTQKQMDALRLLIDAAAKLPSQGRGTVSEAMNVHSEPNRQAPSYCQVPEGGSVQVVARVVLPRVAFQGDVIVPPPPNPKKAKKKEEKKEKVTPKVPPPPRPAAPKVPDNWLEMSKRDPLPDDASKKDAKPAQEVKYDEWVLVRTKEGKAGWVLARMVSMAIPDEVAQYAEGARITSYFSLGEIADADGKTRQHWLWTTLSQPLAPYQFDGLRVFIFNARHNRYETAYRERDLAGYYPTSISTVDVTEGKNHFKVPGFTVITQDDSGQTWKKSYAFQGYRVRFLGKEPAAKPIPFEAPKAGDDSLLNLPAQAEAQAKGLWQRTKDKVGRWFRR